MKKLCFHILPLMLFFAVGTISAQKILVQNTADGDSSTAVIVIDVADSSLKKLNLLVEDENKKKIPLSEDIPRSGIVSFKFKLTEGKNTVKLFGLDDNNNVLYSSDTPVIFNRGKSETTIAKQEKKDEPADKTKTFELAPQKIEKGQKADIKFNVPDGVSLFDATKNEPRKFVVEIENGSKKSSDEYDIALEKGKDGQPSSPNKPLAEQQIKIDLQKGTSLVKIYPKGKEKEIAVQTKIECNPCEKEIIDTQTQNFRAVVGVQQVGASSANSEQHPFLNLFINTPVKGGFSVWGDISLTPTAVQTFAALPDVATSLNGANANKPNNLVDSFDFLIGFEQRIPKIGKVFDGFLPGKSRSELSVIVSGGAVLPLSTQNAASIFKIPRDANNNIDERFRKTFPQVQNETNVAFVTPDRSRFFRQYYAGLRLKTFFTNDNGETKKVFPAMFDLSFGQNEAITNRAQGVIMRLDGSTPFPIRNTEFLYLFGGVQMKLGKNVNQTIPPFFLEPASGILLTNPNTLVIPIDQSPFLRSNRDIFRIGIGIDLFKILKSGGNP